MLRPHRTIGNAVILFLLTSMSLRFLSLLKLCGIDDKRFPLTMSVSSLGRRPSSSGREVRRLSLKFIVLSALKFEIHLGMALILLPDRSRLRRLPAALFRSCGNSSSFCNLEFWHVNQFLDMDLLIMGKNLLYSETPALPSWRRSPCGGPKCPACSPWRSATNCASNSQNLFKKSPSFLTSLFSFFDSSKTADVFICFSSVKRYQTIEKKFRETAKSVGFSTTIIYCFS